MTRKLDKNQPSFLSKYWIICLVLVLGSALIWNFLLNALNAYKPYEEIKLFVECKSYKEPLFEDKAKEALKVDQSVLNTEIYVFSESDSSLTSYYQKFGNASDLVILNSVDLTDMGEFLSENFAPLDSLNLTYSEVYKSEEVTYGVKVDSPIFTFTDYFEFDSAKEYYLLLNKKSSNIKNIVESSVTNNALSAYSKLLEVFTR